MTLPVDVILRHLNLLPQTPTLSYLNQILAAWSSRIPWESASRIARHQRAGTSQDYAWFAENFFANAIKHGTGGTCFESNFALRALLLALGFDCTLHFCDMEKEEPNPHCAVIVNLGDTQFIADAGYPIPSALELHSEHSTAVKTSVYDFAAIPLAVNRWEVRRRAGSYESQAFILKGEQVDETTFRNRLIRDHEQTGLFLNEVIISRTNSNCMWRFSESKGLVKRTSAGEETVDLLLEQASDLPSTLAQIFDYDRDIIEIALSRQAHTERP